MRWCVFSMAVAYVLAISDGHLCPTTQADGGAMVSPQRPGQGVFQTEFRDLEEERVLKKIKAQEERLDRTIQELQRDSDRLHEQDRNRWKDYQDDLPPRRVVG